MTTELSTLNTEIALTEQQIAEMIAAEMQSDRDANAFQFLPSRIKMPSGSPPYAFASGDDFMKTFTATIIVSQIARAYWPGKETQGLPPVCSSPDGMVGWLADSIDEEQSKVAIAQYPAHPGLRTVNAERGPYACNRCPLAAWGTGNGRGQACKSLRRLLLLVDGWSMPVILTLPPTSTRVFDDFASARQSKGKAYFACRIEFSLEEKKNASGIRYAAVKLTKLDELSNADLSVVLSMRVQFTELVRNMEITAAEYETVPVAEDTQSARSERPNDVPF